MSERTKAVVEAALAQGVRPATLEPYNVISALRSAAAKAYGSDVAITLHAVDDEDDREVAWCHVLAVEAFLAEYDRLREAVAFLDPLARPSKDLP